MLLIFYYLPFTHEGSGHSSDYSTQKFSCYLHLVKIRAKHKVALAARGALAGQLCTNA